MGKIILFPKAFLWGAATSSYQIEGNNTNNEWYAWERDSNNPHQCGKAVDSYHRFEEDFELAKFLKHNAHRLSLEWSRIQPEQNHFDENQIRHYKKVISSLRERNIKPIVTLHHFTNPLWLYHSGCWLNPKASDYFADYVDKVTEEFSDSVDYWITINEPLVYIYNSYVRGIWPPQERSLNKARLVLENLIKAHLKAYKIIHKNCPKAQVSIAKHLRIFSPCSAFNFGQNSIAAFIRNRIFNFRLLNFLIKKKSMDFIGVNYYAKDFVKFSITSAFSKDCLSSHHKLRKSSLGWFVSPEGIFDILMRLKKFGLPIIITENGTTENEEHFYEDYLRKHLFYISKAIEKGINVIGYLWWSLIDNFEWERGYEAKFGLLSVDKDLNRQIKPFAYIYKEICTHNRIEHD